MILIVGLGNPEKKYQKTRHNIGFIIIESLKLKVKSFSDWKKSKNINCLYAKGIVTNQEIELIKPLTYMNNSGNVVRYAMKKYSLDPKNIFVVHDDIDLPLGKIRIVKNRGAAGHKGVESIICELKTKNFVRFRIGIQPKSGKPKNIEKFVLQKPSATKSCEVADETKSQRPFNKEEEKIVKKIIQKTVEAIEMVLEEGLEKAMNKFN